MFGGSCDLRAVEAAGFRASAGFFRRPCGEVRRGSLSPMPDCTVGRLPMVCACEGATPLPGPPGLARLPWGGKGEDREPPSLLRAGGSHLAPPLEYHPGYFLRPRFLLSNKAGNPRPFGGQSGAICVLRVLVSFVACSNSGCVIWVLSRAHVFCRPQHTFQVRPALFSL